MLRIFHTSNPMRQACPVHSIDPQEQRILDELRRRRMMKERAA